MSNNKKAFIIVLFVLVLEGLLYLFDYLYSPQIKLKGDKRIELNYKELYKEKGYTATFRGEDITKDVKIKNNVNSNKLGKYEIIYEVNNHGLKRKQKRRIKVLDKSLPEINLSKEKNIYVCPNEEFKEEKYTAFDNYDGDITSKVKVIKNKDTVTYSVKDSSNNKREITKKIFYEDKEKPVIEFPSNKIYAFVNEEYKWQDYKAYDNCDKDLTSKVKINNKVNITELGTYEIIYEVIDESGNKRKVSREVIVKERNKPGTIYLTFDDGPRQGTTNVILDILKEEGIEATFFVTNSGPDSLIKREYDEGHTVALHTSTHDYKTVYASPNAFFNDLNTISERVKRITGEESKLIRFPGGSSNTISRRYNKGIMTYLTKEVVNRGYKYYDWNISSGDAAWGNHTKEEIYSNVVNNLRKDRINMVLMHDIKPYTRDALRDIIKYGKANGYTFSKITYDTDMVRQRVNN